MIKRLLSVMLACALLLSAAAVFTSCGEEAEFPVKIGSITVEKEPENIVILDKNLADIISAIGYDVKMVGRSDDVDQKGLKVAPSMGTAQDPSVTNIIKAKAEIVFTDKSLNDADDAKLKKAGVIVAQFESANTLKQLRSLYVKIGRMLGGNNTGRVAAVKAFKEIRDTLTAVKTAAKRDKTVSTLAYLYADNGVLKTVNSGCWASTVLDYTGSVNVFKNAETDVVDINNLMLADPNYIFV
ncbi:MAG: ABC transporter substrate-binding protein, partial [Ruminococcus sp.]|nr:ABC transporter substrate-binding protein [Ruminococcus sp.]